MERSIQAIEDWGHKQAIKEVTGKIIEYRKKHGLTMYRAIGDNGSWWWSREQAMAKLLEKRRNI